MKCFLLCFVVLNLFFLLDAKEDPLQRLPSRFLQLKQKLSRVEGSPSNLTAAGANKDQDGIFGKGYSSDELQAKIDVIKLNGKRRLEAIAKEQKIQELEDKLAEIAIQRKKATERGQVEELTSLESRVKKMEAITQQLSKSAQQQVDLLKTLQSKKTEKPTTSPTTSSKPQPLHFTPPPVDIVFNKLMNDLHLSPTTSINTEANNVNPYAILTAAALAKQGNSNPDLNLLLNNAGALAGLGGGDRNGVVQADGLHPTLVVPTIVDRSYLHAFPRAEPLADANPVLSNADSVQLANADALLASLAGGGSKDNNPLSQYPVVAEYQQ